VQATEDGWKSRDPERFSLAFAEALNGATAQSSSTAEWDVTFVE